MNQIVETQVMQAAGPIRSDSMADAMDALNESQSPRRFTSAKKSAPSTTGMSDASSRGEGDSSGTARKKTTISRLKKYAVLLLLFSLAISIIMAAIQFSQLRTLLNDALKNDASLDLSLIEFHYHDQLITVEEALGVIADDSSIQAILENKGGNGDAQEALSLLNGEAANLNLAFIAVLDKQGKIALSPNLPSNQTWDIHGLVGTVLASPQKGSLVKSDILSFDEVSALNENNWEPREWSLRARQSMYETNQSAGLVRIVVQPVFDFTNSACIGVVVSMENMQGNLDLFELISGNIGDGFFGIYFEKDGSILPASYALFQDSTTLNFKWKPSQSELQAIAGSALSSGSGVHHVTTLSSRFGNYFVSSTRVKALCRNGEEVQQNQSSAFMVRGYDRTVFDSNFNYEVSVTCALMAACVVFEVLAVSFAVRFFIDPLEDLVRYVSRKKWDKYDEILTQLMSTRGFLFRVGGTMFLSLGFLAAGVALTHKNLISTTYSLSDPIGEMQGVINAYEDKMLRMVGLKLYCLVLKPFVLRRISWS
jgi:hypothetical protein